MTPGGYAASGVLFRGTGDSRNMTGQSLTMDEGSRG